MLKAKNITPTIISIKARDAKELSSAFMRFQEYYEHICYKGKIFTRRQILSWYRKEFNDSYNNLWAGFNIPQKVLKPFYEGAFNPLTKLEQQFLDIVPPKTQYIIGHIDSKAYKHELAHALFYVDKQYKKNVCAIIEKHKTEKGLIRESTYLEGFAYNNSTLIDEINAYSIDEKGYIARGSTKRTRELIAEYKKALEKWGLKDE